ncbi:SixA phosphatase family protein [Salinimicrobium terrae]|uniref:SixA phosphatase family protein n=1 Tax=Salinimicrobium terrae TaxID=470866 RepID=UPI00041A86AF|nr:phosphoglycerate mutase family protein [Salinimicrobium terrae]
METFIIFLISFLSLGSIDQANEQPVQETTTYYFVRHAEKDESDPKNKDPKLSAEGQKRVQEWIEIFKDVQFDLILSTNYERTRTTASGIAASQEKEVQFYDPRKLYDQDFQKKTEGQTVLVVGHSNTNPSFVNMILGSEKHQALDEKEYGSLFKVMISPTGEKTSEVEYHNN